MAEASPWAEVERYTGEKQGFLLPSGLLDDQESLGQTKAPQKDATTLSRWEGIKQVEEAKQQVK